MKEIRQSKSRMISSSGQAEILASAQIELGQIERSSERAAEAVARAFKSLARQADDLLKQASSVVGCVEKESMGRVLTSVQALCVTVRELLGTRLEAATAILGTLREEEGLLRQLIFVTQNQEAIASHLRALSVLTNVEIGRLGNTGGNFHLLAQELSTFSRSLTIQTLNLARDTERRQQSIADIRKELASSLPRFRSEMAHMEEGLARTLQVIDAALDRQSSIPSQFRRCAEDTTQQIAGVVAALQAHDITRQQIEHVQQSLQLIALRITSPDASGAEGLPSIYAGLNIQIYQLKSIQQTVTTWTSQVRSCIDGIQRLSASEIATIGPTVLRQEKELSSELAHIERLQQKSQEYSGRMHSSLGGLSGLVDLVNAHLRRSQAIRDRLQILMLNSLVEAQRLGVRGAVVSAIAGLIKEVSEEWNAIEQQSRLALNKILALVQQTSTQMESFSEATCQVLHEKQAETEAALQTVRSAAKFVSEQAAHMQSITTTMQGNVAAVSDAGDRLEASFGHLVNVLHQLEGVAQDLELESPQMAGRCDTAEVEQWLSACYTTEIERSVMSAALHGTAMPVVQASFAGNAVELF